MISAEPVVPGSASDTDVRSIAAALLEQARRCRVLGLAEQGRMLLTQAWAIAESTSPDLSDTIAWELGWMCSNLADNDAASDWFKRVRNPVEPGSDIWPQLRSILDEHHQRLAQSAHCPLDDGRQPPELTVPKARWSSDTLPMLDVNNLGHFRITREGVALRSCKSRKAVSIFRYLLTRNNWAATREELVEQFWPNVRIDRGTHNLHTTVSMLRAHLDPPACQRIVFESGRYVVNPDVPIRIDSACFQDGLAQADRFMRERETIRAERAYEDVLALYVGDYYVHDPDNTWEAAEREHLLAGYLMALDRLGRLYMQRHAFELAVACFQRLIERDVYREDIYTQLMQCYLRLGRRTDALKQYDHCASVLQRDLGLEPGVEMCALHQTAMSAQAAHC